MREEKINKTRRPLINSEGLTTLILMEKRRKESEIEMREKKFSGGF